MASRPATCGTGVRRLPISVSNTWPTLEAGSVLTSSTRLPLSARLSAVAQASEVLPTPPLPVKKTNLGRSLNTALVVSGYSISGEGVEPQQAVEPQHAAVTCVASPPPVGAFGQSAGPVMTSTPVIAASSLRSG